MAARLDALCADCVGCINFALGGGWNYLEFDMTTAGLIIFILSLLALCIRVVRNPFVRSNSDMVFAVMVWVGLGLIVWSLI
jgi:hypothetical protein